MPLGLGGGPGAPWSSGSPLAAGGANPWDGDAFLPSQQKTSNVPGVLQCQMEPRVSQPPHTHTLTCVCAHTYTHRHSPAHACTHACSHAYTPYKLS